MLEQSTTPYVHEGLTIYGPVRRDVQKRAKVKTGALHWRGLAWLNLAGTKAPTRVPFPSQKVPADRILQFSKRPTESCYIENRQSFSMFQLAKRVIVHLGVLNL